MDITPNLNFLPEEILLQIFKEESLSIKDISNLSKTCSRFNIITQSQDLWKAKFIKK